MAKRMLIDATQGEETRVAVIDGNRLDELDFEIASRRQLKGNIYLAKVTRVEPSLQAAFVEYGGNRQGFLAFAEIHPDYYKIPVADREKLIALEREEAEREAAEEEAALNGQGLPVTDAESEEDELSQRTPGLQPQISPEGSSALSELGDVGNDPAAVQTLSHDAPASVVSSYSESPPDFAAIPVATSDEHGAAEAGTLSPEGEVIPPPPTHAEDGDDDADRRKRARRRANILRQYKIQEVIKKNQIMLIQVVKEERGNKGAALTSYLSLAGRYCVLMPNTNRGGGVSRKINSIEERRRMKSLLAELDLPEGMSIILRTAGLERGKADIKRDLEYLVRLWDSIREKTLTSNAPSLIHEEANLIRRAIRDLYSREVQEVQVEGDNGYRIAKDFMRMLVPSAARRVHHYRDPAVPLFVRHRVESQIESLYSTTVGLKSGGYIVINQTEALVAIDVNSGRSTRERNIEETALRTNLEAADEVARQVRLRDLAGLIVIDFIDMEEQRHNGQVERRLREAMKSDRARIQLGRISMFGLMELSRQRLRPSLIETNFSVCQSCGGTGHVRSVESAALHVLRSVEEEGLQQKASELAVTVAEPVALYLLNHKRAALSDIERRYGIKVFIHSSAEITKNAEHKIERLKTRQPGEFTFPEPPPPLVEEEDNLDTLETDEDTPAEDSILGTVAAGDASADNPDAGPEGEDGRRRRSMGRNRRGGRGRLRERPAEGNGYDVSQPGAPQPELTAEALATGVAPVAPTTLAENGAAPAGDGETGEQRRRRRGRRGGRGRFRDRPPRDGAPLDGSPQPEVIVDAGLPSADEGLTPVVREPRSDAPNRRRFRERGHERNGERGNERGGDRGAERYSPRPPAAPPSGEGHTAASAGGIRIVSEYKARETPTPPPPAAMGGTPAATSEPAANKPKSGWWKRLIGSES